MKESKPFNFYNNTFTNDSSNNYSPKWKNMDSRSLAEIKIYNRLNSNTN